MTGANGFLGQHIQRPIKGEIISLGKSRNNNISLDLSCTVPKVSKVDVVIHNAGLAHVIPQNRLSKRSFYSTNYQGTLNLLEGLESCPQLPEQFIFISTVAVYGKEAGEMISEDYPLSGATAYARSKILAEQAVKEWCNKNGVQYVILRLPLVVGENPPGNLGALYKSIKNRKYIRISGNKARKSVVLAKDVAELIPRLNGKRGTFNLTDGVHPTFEEIEQALELGTGQKIRYSLPSSVFHAFGIAGNILKAVNLPVPLTSDTIKKLTATLTFDDSRARVELGWFPRPVLPWIKSHLH